MSQHDKLTWPQAVAISDIPEVNKAIQVFSLDATGDNAVGIILAVAEALSATQPAQALTPEVNADCRQTVIWSLMASKSWTQDYAESYVDAWLDAQPAQAAQSEPANGDALGYATRLAKYMWERDWRADAPDWKPFPHLLGVLTQIDNMVSGMERKQAAQGAGEVVYQIKGDVFQCPHAWRDTDEETFHMVPAKDRRIVYTAPAQPAPVVPDGWKLVPVEPTPEMLDAARRVAVGGALRAAWTRMLAATPTPPAQAAQQGGE